MLPARAGGLELEEETKRQEQEPGPDPQWGSGDLQLHKAAEAANPAARLPPTLQNFSL